MTRYLLTLPFRMVRAAIDVPADDLRTALGLHEIEAYMAAQVAALDLLTSDPKDPS